MRNPQFGQFLMDDDPADHKAPFRLKPPIGWDLRDEPPEEEPVTVYRLTQEEIAGRYGPPKTGEEVVNVGEQPQTEQAQQPAEKWPVGPERLRELFIDQGLDRGQIARMCGTTTRAVASALGRHKIRRKTQLVDGLAGTTPAAVQPAAWPAVVQISDQMAAPCAKRVLESIAAMLDTNPLMTRVSVELQVRAVRE